ncbi:MAG TPA: transporter substrate-binding domain-containing protein [Hanamia sp.]|nr:transporter substrate-binding domain-containing protein [Hanamia sp.]
MFFKNYFFRFFLFPALLLFPGFTYAQDTSLLNNQDTTSLHVGIAGSAPFIIHRDNNTDGISLEIWQSVAAEAGWHYTLQSFETVDEALQNLKNGKIDVVVGPISITSERAKMVRFTQPYYQSSLSILSRSAPPTLWERIEPFFSKKLLIAIFIFIFILGCVGTLLWLAERKENPEQFPSGFSRGVGNGMWCAIVTMSTTGYGDIAPRTFAGRIIAGSWMVISIIFATSMVAGIASTLTLTAMNHTLISNAEDLNHKNIAVMDNSPASKFITEYGGKKVIIQNISDGVQLLKEKKADALVFDRPQLLYYLQKHPEKDMTLSHSEYEKQGYGFVFPLHSTLVHTANIYLLHDAESDKTERIIDQWLGEEEE